MCFFPASGIEVGAKRILRSQILFNEVGSEGSNLYVKLQFINFTQAFVE